jgi:hypothetical protein
MIASCGRPAIMHPRFARAPVLRNLDSLDLRKFFLGRHIFAQKKYPLFRVRVVFVR